jgi:hypothetical protein
VLSGCLRSTLSISAPIVGWSGRTVIAPALEAVPGWTSGPASVVIGFS